MAKQELPHIQQQGNRIFVKHAFMSARYKHQPVTKIDRTCHQKSCRWLLEVVNNNTGSQICVMDQQVAFTEESVINTHTLPH
jgi:hypothetical protein